MLLFTKWNNNIISTPSPLQQTFCDNIVQKRRNCSQWAISPFPTMFSTLFNTYYLSLYWDFYAKITYVTYEIHVSIWCLCSRHFVTTLCKKGETAHNEQYLLFPLCFQLYSTLITYHYTETFMQKILLLHMK